ncbi:MAG: hydroxypyruvate isomerase [Thauera sp.]|nr:hydroxypyruvate isomerase [Thauera sp.]
MPRFAANLTMMFDELPFLERFAAAAETGFHGVEFLSPYAWPAEKLREQLRANGLTQVLFNLPPGDWDAGERGLACLPDRIAEFGEGLARALDYAAALGCRQLHCMAGIAPAGLPVDVLHRTYVDNLRRATQAAAKAGVNILIEPINHFDMPGYFLNRSDQALRILDEVGADNLLLQYDIYHAQRSEGELAATIARCLPRIGHMQLADNPGRHEPGTGEINYPFLFDHIDRLGYQGWIGCEYRPRAGTLAGLGWLPPRSDLDPRA